MLFDKEIQSDSSFNQKIFKSQTEEIIKELEKLEEKYTIEKIFDNCMDKINELFNNVKNNKESLISNYENDLEKLIKSELDDKIKELLEKLNSEIENTMCVLDEEVKKNKDKLLKLFNIGLEKELKSGKYKAEIDVIIKFSFYEKLQLNLSHYFGANLYMKKIANGVSTISILIASYTIFNVYGLGVATAITLTSWILGKTKGSKKILDEKLEEALNQYSANFERARRKFSRLFRETLRESKTLFKDLLSIASIDLSKVEKTEWNNLKEIYFEVKNQLYSISKYKTELFK